MYRAAKVVGNICVHASPDKTKPIAIIVPVEPALKKLAEQNGIPGSTLEELVHDKKMKGVVLKELQNAGRAGRLSGFEIIDGVVLADEEWTPANVSCLPHFYALFIILVPNRTSLIAFLCLTGFGHRSAEAAAQGYSTEV